MTKNWKSVTYWPNILQSELSINNKCVTELAVIPAVCNTNVKKTKASCLFMY